MVHFEKLNSPKSSSCEVVLLERRFAASDFDKKTKLFVFCS